MQISELIPQTAHGDITLGPDATEVPASCILHLAGLLATTRIRDGLAVLGAPDWRTATVTVEGDDGVAIIVTAAGLRWALAYGDEDPAMPPGTAHLLCTLHGCEHMALAGGHVCGGHADQLPGALYRDPTSDKVLTLDMLADRLAAARTVHSGMAVEQKGQESAVYTVAAAHGIGGDLLDRETQGRMDRS